VKVVFNGVLESVSGGCKPCGARKASKLRMVSAKTYILPSGKTTLFRAGKEVEVEDEDGEFLLTYKYGEEKKPVFTKVD